MARQRPNQRNKVRILIAERDPVLARTIAAFLRSHEFEVTVVESASAVLDQAAPEILIANAGLRDQSVFELCEELQLRNSLPWTILTGTHPSEADYRRAMRLGIRDLLSSPVRLDDLLRSVEAALKSRPTAPENPGTFERSFECVPSNFARILRELLAFALRSGVGPTARARIGTACSEILENAWEHGYEGEQGPVHIRANVTVHDFEVEVRDEGLGFDTFTASALALDSPLDAGIARAGSLSEDMRLDSKPGCGSTVQLNFAAYRVDFDNDEDSLDLSEWDYLAPEFSRRLGDEVAITGEMSAMNLSPALAVVVGRMLSGPTPMVRALRTLWS